MTYKKHLFTPADIEFIGFDDDLVFTSPFEYKPDDGNDDDYEGSDSGVGDGSGGLGTGEVDGWD